MFYVNGRQSVIAGNVSIPLTQMLHGDLAITLHLMELLTAPVSVLLVDDDKNIRDLVCGNASSHERKNGDRGRSKCENDFSA